MKQIGYRNIIEKSIMINNDEYVFYSKEEYSFEKAVANGTKLVFSRPLFQEEVDAGLKPHIHQPLMDEDTPEITHWLDALFRLINGLKHPTEIILGINYVSPSKRLANYIGSHYYDCMSGGCSGYVLSIVNELCKHPSINLNEETYPHKNTWLTLQDFLNEMDRSNLPPCKLAIKEILNNLPICQKNLLPYYE